MGAMLENGMKLNLWRGLSILTLTIAPAALAHDIITTNLTYTRDISRIFAQRCISCHSETASIPLTTYEETRPWAVGIKEQILARTMPPWGAVKGFGNLSPDGALSQEEILIISAWVIGGAPQGDPQLLATKSQPTQSTAPQTPILADGPTVTGQSVLQSAVHIAGIRPLTDKPVASARITALLPDGRVQPLLWLFRYDPRFPHTFTFRDQVMLPERTVIESSAPLSFVLQVATNSSPAR